MSGILFTSNSTTGTGRVHDAHARLSSGEFLTISAAQSNGRVSMGLSVGMVQACMVFTPSQARSVARELLASAKALGGAA